MNVTGKLLLAPFLALAFVWPVQAQPGGDYYAPGPTTVVHGAPDQLKRNEQGDYYVGNQMILNKHRMEALKKCTEGTAFDSDRYVACMAREGEAPETLRNSFWRTQGKGRRPLTPATLLFLSLD